ncbi:MAG: polysaccharide pyruvyl transferase family protein [Propionibacteriaceae bacterium]|nr:polysaccharide pyruvyl transferase family protein [Propionibacteriaceae bacterium]
MRILLRAHKSPFRVASAGKTLSKNLIGNNVGNLVFSQSVYRLLSTQGTKIDARKFVNLDPDRVNANYDLVVVPLADAFRKSFTDELQAMTDLFNRLTIPVVVLGVGCQGPVSGRIPASGLDAIVKEFVSSVLNRSATMGVRGEVTAGYLKRLGFGSDVVDVIGCPSMFMAGPNLSITKTVEAITEQSRISMNISPYVPKMGPISLDHAARYQNLIYTAQDHLTLGLMLTGTYYAKKPQPEGSPTTLDHPLLSQNRTRFCVDPTTWIRHLSGFDFSFGSRIHGNIVALLAGVPAVVLAHDSRTLELADYHEIPRQILTGQTDVDAADLYAGASWEATLTGHSERWERVTEFLRRNDLAHVYLPGQSPRKFDQKLKSIRFPKPVSVGDFTARRFALTRAMDTQAEPGTSQALIARVRNVRQSLKL